MAGDLSTLIRLAEAEVDESRLRVAERRRRVERLARRIEAIEEALERERKSLRASPIETGDAYGRYVQAAVDKRRALERTAGAAEADLADALAELTARCRRFRALELAAAARARARAAADARAEQSRLDDIARDRHRRTHRPPTTPDTSGQES